MGWNHGPKLARSNSTRVLLKLFIYFSKHESLEVKAETGVGRTQCRAYVLTSLTRQQTVCVEVNYQNTSRVQVADFKADIIKQELI